MRKPKKSTIEVQGTGITILSKELGDYISLTDMVRNFEGGSALIEQWLKSKETVLFLGVWEQIHNPGFNSLEFQGIRNEAGRNSFFLSVKAWIDRTRAKGLTAAAGRYGGTYSNPHPTAETHGQQRPAPTRPPERPPGMTGARSTAAPESGSGVPPLTAGKTQRQDTGSTIAPETLAWLGLIREDITPRLSIDPEDFEYTPFGERCELGKAHQLFGGQLPKLLDELNEVLAA